jgi:hypothetical protein
MLLVLMGVGGSVAQTNSWISPTRGYWDDYTKWSLGVAPSTNGQTLILITNDVDSEVTIDSITADDYPTTMIISDLVVSAPGVATNTLELSEAGTNTPLQVLDTLIITNGGVLDLSDSALSVEGSSNAGFSVDGSVFIEGNSVVTITPSLYAGLDSNALGSITVTGGQVVLMSGGAIGVNSAGQMTLCNAQLDAWNDVFVGSGEGSTGAFSINGGTFIPTYGCRFIVGMETGAVGAVSVNSGTLMLTNSFLTLVGGDGSGRLNLLGGTTTFGPMEVGGDPGSEGTLTIAGGTNTLQAGLAVGASLDSTGAVWLTGGQVVATNLASLVSVWGNGTLTVSNGSWLGNSLLTGLNASQLQIYTNPTSQQITIVPAASSSGTVNLNGGTMTLYTKLVIGNCPSGGVGVVNVAGGSLYVTNAAHTGSIYLNSGELNLSGGLLQADILIMTNGCGSYAYTSGTLILSNLVDGIPTAWKVQYGFNPLDPTLSGNDLDGTGFTVLQDYLAGLDPTNSASVFRITSIQPSGNDIGITWSVVTGKTYLVQMTTNLPASGFTNLGTVTVPASPVITQTNYLDLGAVTNGPTRFYRIQLVTPP